jgi:formiminotetrahydrofolate cyclodeaminase
MSAGRARPDRRASDYLDEPLGDFVAGVAGPDLAPAAGSCAAIVAALAAGLATMAARSSELEGVEERCGRLIEDVAPLAQADSEAYDAVVRATGEAERRTALASASEVPLAVAEAGREVAEIAAELFERGNPKLKGESAAAALLGESAARVASVLVAMNLAWDDRDTRVTAAAQAAEAAGRAAQRAGGGADVVCGCGYRPPHSKSTRVVARYRWPT